MSATATAAPTSAALGSARPEPSVALGPRRDEIVDITLGETGLPLGVLRHVNDGPIECTQFSFDRRWLDRNRPFSPSPDLRCHAQDQWRSRPRGQGSPFFAALADTHPDGFARSILDQALSDSSVLNHGLASLESRALSSLCAVHDFCRLGALRIRPRDADLVVSGDRMDLPTHVDLDPMFVATAAFEQGHADPRQLQLLLSSATALGGTRPKICFLQEDRTLAVAKFHSVFDEHSAVKAEMLAFLLAKKAGVQVPEMRLIDAREGAVLIVQRFDRGEDGRRSPYLSARSLLLAEDGEELSYMDLLNRMRTCCKDFNANARQLWRRLMFKLLINDAGTALHKIGFLYAGRGRWRLAPATGLRPYVAQIDMGAPGTVWDVEELIRQSPAFELSHAEARGVLASLLDVIGRWRSVASQFAVGMKPDDIARLEGAMNNPYLLQAKEMVAKQSRV